MQKSSFKEYLIELLIVIIGITVAFSLNNLAEARKESNLERKYLEDIRSDLERDSLNLTSAIKFNKDKIVKLENVIALIMNDQKRQFQDSLMNGTDIIGSYVFFYPESFTLNSLLQSGDFKLIASDDLKKELLRLRWMYDRIQTDQTNFLSALDNNYYPRVLAARDVIENKIVDLDFYYGIELKNYTGYTYNDTNNMTYYYNRILEQVRKVMGIINKELS